MMNRLLPPLTFCAIASAVLSLSACGGGDPEVRDCITAEEIAATQSVPAPTASTESLYKPPHANDDDRDDDDDDNDEREEDDDDGKASDIPICPANTDTTSSQTTPATPAPAPQPPTNTSTPAPAPAPTPAPAPAPAPTPAPAPAPAPAPSASAPQGKSLYAANCAGCHGGNPAQNISKILRGRSASATLSAIAGNKGGMGYLSGKIGAKEASDIAAYLANPGI